MESLDVRLKATIWIWTLSSLMLLTCTFFFVFIDQGILLPLAVLAAATVSTVSVWIFGTSKAVGHSKEIQELKSRISDLERIADVIDFDKRLMDK